MDNLRALGNSPSIFIDGTFGSAPQKLRSTQFDHEGNPLYKRNKSDHFAQEIVILGGLPDQKGIDYDVLPLICCYIVAPRIYAPVIDKSSETYTIVCDFLVDQWRKLGISLDTIAARNGMNSIMHFYMF